MTFINYQTNLRFQQLNLVLEADDTRFEIRWADPKPPSMPILSHNDFKSIAYLHTAYVLGVLGLVQASYAVYYVYRMGNVVNRTLYTSFWTQYQVKHCYPVLYVCLLVSSYATFVISMNIDPFLHIQDLNLIPASTGQWIMFRLIMADIACMTHIILLSKFAEIHTTIMQHINDQAEM